MKRLKLIGNIGPRNVDSVFEKNKTLEDVKEMIGWLDSCCTLEPIDWNKELFSDNIGNIYQEE